MTVFIVIPRGVYGKPPAAVCLSHQEATEIAWELWDASDAYHTFDIWEAEAGEMIGDVVEMVKGWALYEDQTTRRARRLAGKPDVEPVRTFSHRVVHSA